MVYPEFQPGQDYAGIENANIAGQNAGMSMMQRATEIQGEKQRQQIQAQQWQLQQPVMAAKAHADAAQAGADYSNILQSEQQRADVNGMIPQARQDMHDIMLDTDEDSRLQSANEWMAKYGQIGNVAAYKGEWDGYKTMIAQMHAESMAMNKINATADMYKNIWQQRGQTQTDVATIRAGAQDRAHMPETQKLLEAMQDAKDSGDQDGVNFYQQRLQKLGQFAPAKMNEMEQLMGLKRKAEQSGDAEAAQFYGGRLAKLNYIAPPDPEKAAIAGKITGQPAAAGAAPVAPGGPAAKPAMGPGAMTDQQLNSYFFGGGPTQ